MKKGIFAWLVILLCACAAETITHEPVKEAQAESTYEPHITVHREEVITTFEPPTPLYTDEEITLMAMVVQREYGHGDETDKRLVVSVILNRVEDEDFPNTIEGVIRQPNQFAIAKWHSIESENAVRKEIEERTRHDILWFCSGGYPKWGNPVMERNGHYFSGRGE